MAPETKVAAAIGAIGAGSGFCVSFAPGAGSCVSWVRRVSEELDGVGSVGSVVVVFC